MHIGLGSLIVLGILCVACFGPRAVKRAAAGLAYLFAILVAIFLALVLFGVCWNRLTKSSSAKAAFVPPAADTVLVESYSDLPREPKSGLPIVASEADRALLPNGQHFLVRQLDGSYKGYINSAR